MNLYLGTSSDSIFLDITGRDPVQMRKVGEGVLMHLDSEGNAVAFEMFDVSKRGGLGVEDLDGDQCI